MLSEQTTENTAEQVSRCDERDLAKDFGNNLSPLEKQDANLKTNVTDALWKDEVLRTLEYDEIDILVKSGVVTLNGHITSSRSQNRVGNALHAIPGIVEIKNNLVSDDKLTLDVAKALGNLEHVYHCKFFTGASHGVISINGTVSTQNIRSLAEKCASDTPHIRGVINNIQVQGKQRELQSLPFLQPAIGENIYFLDGASGVVKQVVMNPNNRRVIAMIVLGKFTSQMNELHSMSDDQTASLERLAVVPMDTVRHVTKTSVFLLINSDQRSNYLDFAPVHFVAPHSGWLPPYPYCPEDVLFPVEHHEKES